MSTASAMKRPASSERNVILDKGVKILPGRNLQGYDNFPIVIRKNQTV